MTSSKISINSLLSGNSSTSPSAAPAPAQQNTRAFPTEQARNKFAPANRPRQPASVSPTSPPEFGSAQGKERTAKHRKRHAPMIQRAITSPQEMFNRNQTPTLPHSAVIQAQLQNTSPTVSSGSTIGSTIGSSHSMHSTQSTPSGDYRSPLGYGPVTMTPPAVPPRRTSTEKMDFLADLAAMQNPQQGTPQSSRHLRASASQEQPRSPSMPTLSRRSSTYNATADHPMTDAPTATLQPRTFKNPSLDKSELQTVSELTKQLAENTFLYDSHAKLLKLLHKGLMTHVWPSDDNDTIRNPHDYGLLNDLRQARAAMDSRFPLGEELWLEWIQDECMLARTTDDRIAVMELCQKAVQDEVGSTRIWRLYGDWMWVLYRTAHDITGAYETNSLEQHPVIGALLAKQRWTEDEKVVGREVLVWDLLVGVWTEAIKATEWRIDESNVVWDSYLEILMHDLLTTPTSEKTQQIYALFTERLRQPHATWDNTFQRFSQFVSEHDQTNYEGVMVSTNEDAADAKAQHALRQEYEFRLQRAAASGDLNAEWTIMTEYLDWESAQLKKAKKYTYGFDLFVALLTRANLRFPTDAELWEEHVDFLTEHPLPRYSLLQVARNATRHCPWSGNLWSKRLVILEAAGNAFNEIEDVKHHATSSGLLEGVGGIDELVKVSAAWCGFLRRRAFANDAGEDERDIAEVGIRSELENVKAIGEKMFGKSYKGEAMFRLNRIYTKFLSQSGRYDEVRSLWLQMSATYGDQWEFWEGFYLWEMTIWGRATAQKGSKRGVPEHATAALQRAIRQPKLDWPERMIEAYIHHCRQHESAQKLQEALVEARKAQKQVVRRRTAEAAEVAAVQPVAAQQYPAINVTQDGDEAVPSAKRKREEDTSAHPVEAPSKRNRADEVAGEQQPLGDTSSSATSQLKRDRENTTVIVKQLPKDTIETKIRQFFRDCGKIVSLQLVPSDDNNSATATIEFESKEDVLTAQTKSMKSFYGHSIEIQVGTGTTLFVTNYPAEADEVYLRNLFQPYGDVVEVRFPSLKFDTHRRFCYIQFLSSSQAQAATQLDGKVLSHNLVLSVKLSDPNAKKSRTGAMEEGRELYVGNVEWKASESELEQIFEKYGKVQHVRIPRNIEGRSKGAAFVVFATKEEAEAALELNLREFRGRILSVSISVSNAKGAKRVAKTVISRASPASESASQHPDQMQDVQSNNAGSPAGSTAEEDRKSAADYRARTLILRNIPDTVNDARIRALAEPHGTLRQIKLRPEAGEAMVEFVDVKDVGKAEMALSGTEIAKGVVIEIGRDRSKQNGGTGTNGGGADHVDVKGSRNKGKMPFVPVTARRPGLGMQGTRRGGHGGLGAKRIEPTEGNKNDGNAADTNGSEDKEKSKPKSNAEFRAFLGGN